MLFSVYIGCLIVGGGLVVASFFADSDHDVDVDVDVDADFDLDADHDIGDASPSVDMAEALWLPFLSLRFWLFFSAFFGLMGTILTTFVLQEAQWQLGLGISLGVGFVLGYAGSKIIQTLRYQKVSSAVDPHRDYVGKRGQVLIDILPGTEGHVRLDVKGASVDLPAITEDGNSFERGASVIVLAYDDGKLKVAKFDAGDQVNDQVPA